MGCCGRYAGSGFLVGFVVGVEAFVQVVDVEIGQDGTGDVVPCTEDGTGDAGHGQGCKVCFGQARCQAGILHADFDGQGDHFLPAHAAEMADKESQGIAQAVVQDDDQQDDARTVEDSIAAGSDDAGDEEGNSQGRNSRQVIRSRISQLRQEALDDEAQSDGDDDDLQDR